MKLELMANIEMKTSSSGDVSTVQSEFYIQALVNYQNTKSMISINIRFISI